MTPLVFSKIKTTGIYCLGRNTNILNNFDLPERKKMRFMTLYWYSIKIELFLELFCVIQKWGPQRCKAWLRFLSTPDSSWGPKLSIFVLCYISIWYETFKFKKATIEKCPSQMNENDRRYCRKPFITTLVKFLRVYKYLINEYTNIYSCPDTNMPCL